MRNLSDQEIKRLYESEYADVPDVWDRVRDEIMCQEREGGVSSAVAGDDDRALAADMDDSRQIEEGTLQFPHMGKKRTWKMVAALAACFVIIGAYVLQNGDLVFYEGKNANGDVASGTEAASPEFAEDSVATEASGTMQAADFSDSQGEMAAENQADEAQEEGYSKDVTGGTVQVNINGRCYTYDAELTVSVEALNDMEFLGEVTYAPEGEPPKEHLTISGMELAGCAYESSTGEIYILEDSTNRVYGFR